MVIGVASLSACVTGCETTSAAAADPFCAGIRQFANASPKSSTRSVELTTLWFTGESGSVEAKCQRSADDDASKALCGTLVEHASREFPVGNIERAFACVSTTGRFEGLPVYAVKSLAGEVSSWEMPGVDQDVMLTITFDADGHDKPPFLRIAAKRTALRQ